MIKLKSILKEINSDKIGGTFNYSFIVNEDIMALCSSNDNLEINVSVYYTGVYLQPEITGHKTTWLILNDKNQIRYDFLHPSQQKSIDKLVENEIHYNEEEIIRLIMNKES